MTSAEVRARFLEFFRERGHTVVPSSSLVPGQRPDAAVHQRRHGPVQGRVPRQGAARLRARGELSQRCVRAGGKHNDLENVGYTARHHTFFEMLGNFSFGDYFKREAIRFAWDFVTGTLGIPTRSACGSRCYEDDDEAAEHLGRGDRRADRTRVHAPGREVELLGHGRHRSLRPVQRDLLRPRPGDSRAARRARPTRTAIAYVEIWNLVFMQFERSADGTLTPLPKPSVDTGVGLERVAAVMQGVHSQLRHRPVPRPDRAAAGTGALGPRTSSPSLRVIADHIRACTLPDRRRRRALERGSRLRAAPDHPPRDAPRLQARAAPAVLPQAGAGARAGDGRGLSGTRRAAGA